jgi:sugar fermentation stimulation protein A
MPSLPFLYPYPPLLPGILLKRYKRFFADIELASGEVITAHCPNTGPMTCISTPRSPVQVSHHLSPTRKLPYTWEMIEVYENQPTWVGINTAMPNRIVKLALEQNLIPGLGNYSQIQMEVPYGADKKSRIDFLLTGNDTDKPIYLEVKSTTWAEGNLVRFPDTVTTRGQKHLRELIALTAIAQPVMLYFINRSDCSQFAPGDSADRVYGELLREAIDRGVTVLPCRFEITPLGIRYLGLAELKLE